MSQFSVKKRKQKNADTHTEGLVHRQRQLGTQIAQSSGSTMFASRDPVYHLMNSYMTTFDAVGKDRARKMSDEPRKQEAEERPDTREERIQQLRKKHDSPMYKHSVRSLEEGSFVDRFSSYAFNGGNMAGAIMAGKGKQMFTACLSRAIGRTPNGTEKQKKILDQTAVEEDVQGTQGSVMFNRDAKSAVGIIVDTMRGASSTFEVFRKLANESGALVDTPVEHRDVDTMRLLYPFMITSQDKAQIDTYKQQLKALEGNRSPEGEKQRKTLEWALGKQTAVLERKMTEQRRFLTMLNRVQTNVDEAEKMFCSDGFVESVVADIERQSMDIPPEDGQDDDLSVSDGLELVSELISEVLDNGSGESRKAPAKQRKATTKGRATKQKQAGDNADNGGGSGGKR